MVKTDGLGDDCLTMESEGESGGGTGNERSCEVLLGLSKWAGCANEEGLEGVGGAEGDGDGEAEEYKRFEGRKISEVEVSFEEDEDRSPT